MLEKSDKRKLGDLYTKNYRSIQTYIISLKIKKSVAECLTQDVFVQLCYDYANNKEITHTKSYLFGLTRNIVHEYRRGTNRLPMISLSNVLENLLFLPTESGNIALRGDNEKKNIFLKTLNKAISELPKKSREALELRYTQNLSLSEAAQYAKCSKNTFYQRVHRAVNLVKAKITSYRSDFYFYQ